jgi:hypothetical protein
LSDRGGTLSDVLQGENRFSGNMISIKLDIGMVRSPDDESVDDGEYERGGVGELSLEVVILEVSTI